MCTIEGDLSPSPAKLMYAFCIPDASPGAVAAAVLQIPALPNRAHKSDTPACPELLGVTLTPPPNPSPSIACEHFPSPRGVGVYVLPNVSLTRHSPPVTRHCRCKPFVLLEFRTLQNLVDLQLPYFHALPHSLQKHPGVGGTALVPTPIRFPCFPQPHRSPPKSGGAQHAAPLPYKSM